MVLILLLKVTLLRLSKERHQILVMDLKIEIIKRYKIKLLHLHMEKELNFKITSFQAMQKIHQ